MHVEISLFFCWLFEDNPCREEVTKKKENLNQTELLMLFFHFCTSLHNIYNSVMNEN